MAWIDAMKLLKYLYCVDFSMLFLFINRCFFKYRYFVLCILNNCNRFFILNHLTSWAPVWHLIPLMKVGFVHPKYWVNIMYNPSVCSCLIGLTLKSVVIRPIADADVYQDPATICSCMFNWLLHGLRICEIIQSWRYHKRTTSTTPELLGI